MTAVDRSAMVREFHTAYGAPIRTGPATLDIGPRLHMRMSLILEEVTELVEAVYGKYAAVAVAEAWDTVRRHFTDPDWSSHDPDVVAAADALADLTYVIDGMALECSIPLDRVFAEVHASNMSKLGEDGKPVHRADGKVLKGPHYRPPDVAGVLEAHAHHPLIGHLVSLVGPGHVTQTGVLTGADPHTWVLDGRHRFDRGYWQISTDQAEPGIAATID